MEVSVTLNGVPHTYDVEPRTLLVQLIREQAKLTGTNIGCDTSSCGACTIHIDGESVKSCTVLAVQADGADITTIEGMATGTELHPMQQAFMENHGLQCGYCTPGMIMAATSLLRENPHAERAGRAHRPRGQPLPLHRLPQHRQVGARRRGRGWWSVTVTERTHPRARAAPAPPRGPRLAHGGGEVHQRPRHHRGAVPRRGPQPLRPRPHRRHRHIGRRGDARRGGRVHRRRPAGCVGRADAVRVAGDRRHEEPAALPPRRRQGVLRGRRGGGRAGDERCDRPRCHRRDRRGVRAARRRRRPRGRAVRPCGHPRGSRHQPLVHLGAQSRSDRWRDRPSASGCGVQGQQALRPATAVADGDGATRGGGAAATVRRRHHAVLGDADTAHPEDHDGDHARHPRTAGARDRTRRWAAGSGRS